MGVQDDKGDSVSDDERIRENNERIRIKLDKIKTEAAKLGPIKKDMTAEQKVARMDKKDLPPIPVGGTYS